MSGAVGLRNLRRIDEAEQWWQRAIDLLDQEEDPGEAQAIAYMGGLGGIAYMRKDWQAALDYDRAAMEVYERENSAALKFSTPLVNEGEVLIELGRFDEAEVALERYLELAEAAWGSDSRKAALGHYFLGVVWREQGRFAESEIALRRSLEIRRQQSSSASPMIAKTLDALGWTIWRSRGDRSREALDHLAQAQEILHQMSKPRYPVHKDVLLHLGEIHLEEDRADQAERHFRDACEYLAGLEEPPSERPCCGLSGPRAQPRGFAAYRRGQSSLRSSADLFRRSG